MTTCLYMRKSTNMQENSIESQNQVLTSFAKKNNLEIICNYIDEGISGRLAAKRPAFMQMIEDSTKGIFEAVLIYDSSRFARNLEESIVYKSILKKNNVIIISVTEPSLDDDTSLITDALLGAMNEMYSRKLSKAVKRGMDFKAKQGYAMGLAPFGYTKTSTAGIPTVNEKETEIVRLIFSLFTTTIPTFSGIAKKLNGEGITKKHGGKWEARDVKRILQRAFYTGVIVDNTSNQFLCSGKHEAIITKEQFLLASSIIESMSKIKTRDNSSYRHWLSGIFRCGQCGSVMTFCPHPTGHHYFRCRENVSGNCKPSVQISVKKAELIANSITYRIVELANVSDQHFCPIENMDETDSTKIMAHIERLEKKLDRYSSAYAEGIDSLDEYKINKKLILEKIKELQKKIICQDERSAAKEIITYREAIEILLHKFNNDNSSISEKNNLMRQFVSHIVYNKDINTVYVHLNY